MAKAVSLRMVNFMLIEVVVEVVVDVIAFVIRYERMCVDGNLCNIPLKQYRFQPVFSIIGTRVDFSTR